jgi:hypothetical protein
MTNRRGAGCAARWLSNLSEFTHAARDRTPRPSPRLVEDAAAG